MSHLTVEQRYIIQILKKQGEKQKEIAKEIGKDPSVVSRELHRNRDLRSNEYKADLAQRKYIQKQKIKKKQIRFTEHVQSVIEKLIRDNFSPEQIVGYLQLKGIESVSHERIYQHIWENKRRGGDLYTHLRTEGKRYRKRGAKKDRRGIVADKISIDERPDVVKNRERFGDFEIDLVIGKNHKKAILTANDRATGYTRIALLQSKSAEGVKEKVIELLMEWKPLLHTITSDNGKEFATHKEIALALDVDYYYAHPYHSWERGSNENYNGLLRQYYPKKSSFEDITEEQLKDVEDKLNNRPRKRFGFLTPNQVYLQAISNGGKIAFNT